MTKAANTVDLPHSDFLAFDIFYSPFTSVSSNFFVSSIILPVNNSAFLCDLCVLCGFSLGSRHQSLGDHHKDVFERWFFVGEREDARFAGHELPQERLHVGVVAI